MDSLLTEEELDTITEEVDRHYEDPMGDRYKSIAVAQDKKTREVLVKELEGALLIPEKEFDDDCWNCRKEIAKAQHQKAIEVVKG